MGSLSYSDLPSLADVGIAKLSILMIKLCLQRFEARKILIYKTRIGATQDQILKIVDFGLAIDTRDSPAITQCGTIEFMGMILQLPCNCNARRKNNRNQLNMCAWKGMQISMLLGVQTRVKCRFSQNV